MGEVGMVASFQAFLQRTQRNEVQLLRQCFRQLRTAGLCLFGEVGNKVIRCIGVCRQVVCGTLGLLDGGADIRRICPVGQDIEQAQQPFLWRGA